MHSSKVCGPKLLRWRWSSWPKQERADTLCNSSQSYYCPPTSASLAVVLKYLTLKATRYWVVNLILRVISPPWLRRPPRNGRPAVRRPFSRWGFSRVESYQWFKNSHTSGCPDRRLSAGTGCLGVCILWLGEAKRVICNSNLSVTAREII